MSTSRLMIWWRQEKINFLAACRLIYDNGARVLRGLCRREKSEFQLSLPNKNLLEEKVELEKIDFSSLVDHLLVRKRTTDQECGSFFEKVSCKFTTFVKPNGTKWLELIPGNNSSVTLLAGGKVQIPTENKSKGLLLKKIEGARYCIPFRKSIKDGASVDVYLPTQAWYTVNDLRIMRNKHLSHNCAANLTNDDLNLMFTLARETYKKLKVHELSNAEEIYKELQEIETSRSILDTIKDRSEEHERAVQRALMSDKKKVEEHWQNRVGAMEDELDAMKTEVGEMKNRVSALETSCHAMQGRLADVETMNRDTRETIKKAVTAGKGYVDSKVDDLQSQIDRGSGPTSFNVFSGHGNTVHVNQSMTFSQSTGGGYTAGLPGSAYQIYTPLQHPQLPSSRFGPGPLTQDEITRLSEEIIRCPLYQMGHVNFTMLAKALGMEECIASISASIQHDSSQVCILLTQWVDDKSHDNSRDRLYKLLCEVLLSFPAYSSLNSLPSSSFM